MMQSNNDINFQNAFDDTRYLTGEILQNNSGSYEAKPEIPVIYSPPIFDRSRLPEEKPTQEPQIFYVTRTNAQPKPKPPIRIVPQPSATTGGNTPTTTTTGAPAATPSAAPPDDDLIFGFKPTTVLLVGGAAAVLFFVMGSEKRK